MAYRKAGIAGTTPHQALECWSSRNLRCGHCCHLPVMAGDVRCPLSKHAEQSSLFSRQQLEVIERWFRSGDIKQTGQLDVEAIKKLWTRLHMDVTHMSAKWLIALADQDRDGKLNFGEFLYLWITAAQNPEFQATPEGAAMLRTMRLHEICPDGERKKFGSCYTLNPWARTQSLDQGDERTDLLQPSHLVEARRLCEDAAKSRAIFIAKAKSLYEGNSQIKQQVQAERRAEFINWARTTFEESRAAGGKGRGHPEAEAHQQITYHDASVCPVMSESTPAISEFSLDQCSFLADWFHRWDRDKDGLLDACEIGSMFHCLRIPIGPGALEAIMQYFDEDMDGKLSFREFLLMWRAALHDPDFRRTAEGCKMAKQMRIHNLLPNRGKAAW